jgi:copper homeostasis protein
MTNTILEICCSSIESAMISAENGADRIELCSSLPEGGVTPSAGIIERAMRELNIPVHVLIRPRGGDFVYTSQEINCMLRDIEICKDLGIPGIVTGALSADGSIDKKTCKLLVSIAQPMKCTFHRALDITPNPFAALDDIMELGFERLLTSGQRSSAEDGMPLIKRMIEYTGKSLIIMPGGGISETNVLKIAEVTGATEFHMSLQTVKHIESSTETVLNALPYKITDGFSVKKVKELLGSAG